MAIRPIVTFDDDILRKKTDAVERITPQIDHLIEDMFETMYNSDGVGLAAPQVGELHRIFVVDTDRMAEENNRPKHGPIAFINPRITSRFGDEVSMEEGCLSIPGVNAAVTRPEKVKVEYRDEKFKKQELEAGGWLSRVIQHEFDHLEGVLFLDYLSTFKKKILSPKLKEISEGRKETEYPLVSKKPTPTR